ncbi:MAG: type II toxin-antitoxin system PemK/MazF family toxin [Candidatus Sungbacteria bacterium]|nr:type II toxin-antitoxin system PemK/MazF family toxin [Candidatus Sungbacteria bacterium]
MAKKQKKIAPRRGEVYLVNFNPTIGSEIRKTRPALVLQNDIANEYSPIVIIAAITSKFEYPLYPTDALVKKGEAGLPRDSVVLLNQIRSVDKRRLRKMIGKVENQTMIRVDHALEMSLGIIKI